MSLNFLKSLFSYLSPTIIQTGGGSAPAAPDYAGAAEKQGAASLEAIKAQTAANRPDQYTPWGSQTWTKTNTFDQAGYDKAMADYQASYKPGTSGGWSNQSYYGGDSGDSGSMVYTPSTEGSYGMAMPDRKAFEGGENWTQTTKLTPELQKALDSQIALQSGRSDLANSFMDRVKGSYAKPFDWGAVPEAGKNVGLSNFITSVDTEGSQRIGGAPGLRTNLDTQAVQNRVNLNDNPALQGANPQERQRIENALFERMRPIHEQQNAALETKLINQGLTPGSEAFNRAFQRQGDQQSRERFNALEVGGNEMARLNQMALGNRQQMTGEDFARANLFNQANQQAFNQDLASGQFGNSANQTQYQMALQQQAANNAANQQDFAQRLASAQFGNSASQAQFAQALQQSQYQNQLRQAGIAEQVQQRQMPLNEMNALLSGQQVQMPSMPQFNSAAAAQPTQYLPAAQLQGQAQLDAYNAQNQNANSLTSGLFGLGGSLGSAAMYAFSDSRLKKIIKRVGEAHGIPIYLFKYLGSNVEHVGPIAQEVQKIRPDLVKRHQNGYLMVNYTRLMEA